VEVPRERGVVAFRKKSLQEEGNFSISSDQVIALVITAAACCPRAVSGVIGHWLLHEQRWW
jgi:hypothetical protein